MLSRSITFSRCLLLKRNFFMSSIVNTTQDFRVEVDSFGELNVPSNKYYGAQTAR